MSDSHMGPPPGAEHQLTLQLDEFAWEAIELECSKLGVSVEEFISFSVLYYLADIDSGRVARRILGGPFPQRRGPAVD